MIMNERRVQTLNNKYINDVKWEGETRWKTEK